MTKIKAVGVDVDDCLIPSEEGCYAVENEALVQLGRGPMSREIHTATWGQPLYDAIVARSPGVNPDEFRRVFEPLFAEWVAEGKIDQVPDANYHALDQVIAMGKLIMIVTSRTLGEAQHLLAPDHLLATRVAGFYHKDNTPHHKPDPRVFDIMLDQHQLAGEDCAYIGDSPGDAQAAGAREMRVIITLESGIRTEADFAGLRVDAFVRRFADLPEALIALEAGD